MNLIFLWSIEIEFMKKKYKFDIHLIQHNLKKRIILPKSQ